MLDLFYMQWHAVSYAWLSGDKGWKMVSSRLFLSPVHWSGVEHTSVRRKNKTNFSSIHPTRGTFQLRKNNLPCIKLLFLSKVVKQLFFFTFQIKRVKKDVMIPIYLGTLFPAACCKDTPFIWRLLLFIFTKSLWVLIYVTFVSLLCRPFGVF